MKREIIWVCRTCNKGFTSENSLIKHLENKSEVLIVLKSDLKKKKEFRDRIKKEMMVDPHEYKQKRLGINQARLQEKKQ